MCNIQEEYYEKFLSDFRSLSEEDQIFLSRIIHRLAGGEITEDEFTDELKKKMLSDQAKGSE